MIYEIKSNIKEQVELDGLKIFLELGKISELGIPTIVCCPEGYRRRGNVEIVCTRARIPFYSNYDSAVGALKTEINKRII